MVLDRCVYGFCNPLSNGSALNGVQLDLLSASSFLRLNTSPAIGYRAVAGDPMTRVAIRQRYSARWMVIERCTKIDGKSLLKGFVQSGLQSGR
jgi:hypothetical protein